MKNVLDNFVVFILSHRRAGYIPTIHALEKAGYTGEWRIVIDDEDDQAPEYFKRYGDKVIQFSKSESAKTVDGYDQSKEHRGVVYARNTCFELARKLGKRFFLELDDDYAYFCYRYLGAGGLHAVFVRDFNKLCASFIKFLQSSKSLLSVAFAQNGDFIGGAGGIGFRKGTLRKAMNTFFCDTEKPFKFMGRVNEDTCAYTLLSHRGGVFLTITGVSLNQEITQQNSGGMTGLYLDYGTHVKSFYSVIGCPSAVKISRVGGGHGVTHWRIHHCVSWNNCAAKIIDERWKKSS